MRNENSVFKQVSKITLPKRVEKLFTEFGDFLSFKFFTFLGAPSTKIVEHHKGYRRPRTSADSVGGILSGEVVTNRTGGRDRGSHHE